MVIHHKFITLNGNASLYLMQYFSENFNTREMRPDDLKVSFNNILSRLCLFWDNSILLFLCLFTHFLSLLSESGNIPFLVARKKILLQFYLSLLRTPFTIILLGSRNLIDFQYLHSHKMYHLVLIECLQIILEENFGKGFRNII